MKFFGSGLRLLLPITAWLACGGAARADTVLYDASGFIQGSQSFVQPLMISSAGTLTVTLTNVDWPEQLASLNMLLTTTGGEMGAEMGAGSDSFSVKPGELFAQWYGTAQGPLDAGVYSMKVEFTPAGSGGGGVNVVPLPTSIALFLSGLVLLLWQRRTRTESPGFDLG